MTASALSPAQAISASELNAFNKQVASAYAPYRSAMFYLRTGNPDVAYLDLDTASAAWQSLLDQYRDTPPDVFADDPGYGDALISIQKTLKASLDLLNKGDLAKAMAILAPVRETIAELRRRNGVHVFGDCIDEMNAAMDRLWIYRQKPPAFDRPEEINAVKRDAAITDYLYRRCYQAAPLAYQSDEAFKRMFEGSFASFSLIYDALDQGNEPMLINLLRELRSFDRMIWLHYG